MMKLLRRWQTRPPFTVAFLFRIFPSDAEVANYVFEINPWPHLWRIEINDAGIIIGPIAFCREVY